MGAQDVAFEVTARKMHVWPLELLDLGDAEQMVDVVKALREFSSRCAILSGALHFLAKHRHPRPQ